MLCRGYFCVGLFLTSHHLISPSLPFPSLFFSPSLPFSFLPRPLSDSLHSPPVFLPPPPRFFRLVSVILCSAPPFTLFFGSLYFSPFFFSVYITLLFFLSCAFRLSTLHPSLSVRAPLFFSSPYASPYPSFSFPPLSLSLPSLLHFLRRFISLTLPLRPALSSLALSLLSSVSLCRSRSFSVRFTSPLFSSPYTSSPSRRFASIPLYSDSPIPFHSFPSAHVSFSPLPFPPSHPVTRSISTRSRSTLFSPTNVSSVFIPFPQCIYS